MHGSCWKSSCSLAYCLIASLLLTSVSLSTRHALVIRSLLPPHRHWSSFRTRVSCLRLKIHAKRSFGFRSMNSSESTEDFRPHSYRSIALKKSLCADLSNLPYHFLRFTYFALVPSSKPHLGLKTSLCVNFVYLLCRNLVKQHKSSVFATFDAQGLTKR